MPRNGLRHASASRHGNHHLCGQWSVAAPRFDGQYRRHARRRCPAHQRGNGIMHSEINDSPKEPVHLLQIWILPDHKDAKPAYAEKSFARAKPGRLHLVASKSGRDGSISINQDADLFLGKLRQTIACAPHCRRTACLVAIDPAVNSTRTAPDSPPVTPSRSARRLAGPRGHRSRPTFSSSI